MGAYESGMSSGLGGPAVPNFANAIRKVATAYRRVQNMDEVNKQKLKWAEETHNAQMAKMMADISFKDQQITQIQFQMKAYQEKEQQETKQRDTATKASGALSRSFTNLMAERTPETQAAYDTAWEGFMSAAPRTTMEMTNMALNYGRMLDSVSSVERKKILDRLDMGIKQQTLMGEGKKRSDEYENTVRMGTDAGMEVVEERPVDAINKEYNEREQGLNYRANTEVAKLRPLLESIQNREVQAELNSIIKSAEGGTFDMKSQFSGILNAAKSGGAAFGQSINVLQAIYKEHTDLENKRLYDTQLSLKTSKLLNGMSRALADNGMGGPEAAMFMRRNSNKMVTKLNQMTQSVQEQISAWDKEGLIGNKSAALSALVDKINSEYNVDGDSTMRQQIKSVFGDIVIEVAADSQKAREQLFAGEIK
jgi:hypothetical protein